MIRWQDWTNMALGAWLVVSPYQLGYSLDGPAASNAMGVGAVLVFFNLISACRLIEEGQEIFNIILGAWLLLSPFSLGFDVLQAAGVNALIVGALIVILAGWQIHDSLRGTGGETGVDEHQGGAPESR